MGAKKSETSFVDKAQKKSQKKRIQIPISTSNAASTRSWTRFVIMCCVAIVAYFYAKSDKETKFALFKDTIPYRMQKLQCSESYLQELSKFPKCIPLNCGRFVSDTVVEGEDAKKLLDFAKTGLALGGSSGGSSIFDLHSGALSRGENFVSIFHLPEAKGIFKEEHISTFMRIKNKIIQHIAEKFSIEESALHLTHPTFFSRMNNVTAKTIHDEYWHPHVDKDTYEAFFFTSLIYLADYGKDFSGGRFIFVDSENINKSRSSIEPKIGRLSIFTSGAENMHYVEKITSGTRYAITIAFTCDPMHAIQNLKFEV